MTLTNSQAWHCACCGVRLTHEERAKQPTWNGGYCDGCRATRSSADLTRFEPNMPALMVLGAMQERIDVLEADVRKLVREKRERTRARTALLRKLHVRP
jgi:hypothetical protein